ncbi:hypothetical protein EOD39_3943 [Acipenser ruthenus]|uniref:Uncharacterized protein n=1 Tax=Acipenser ruthenus TaxID=7906 RepID=A0A444UKL6_ACIRT|nr:hypothetical protein EOD39_3943 [Acipenser ruthenus]
MDLSQLPEEVLNLILRHLPASVLLRNCQYVCKRWHSVIDSQAFWKFKAEEEKKHLQIVKKCVPANFDWKRLCLKGPFNKNLIQNPFGEDLAGICSTFVSSYLYVNVVFTSSRNRQKRIALTINLFLQAITVEFEKVTPRTIKCYKKLEFNGKCFNRQQRCKLTSGTDVVQCWCRKSQTINLLEVGLWEDILDNYQPEICIEDWYSSHRDCGGEYLMKVKLLAADKRTVLQKYNSGLKIVPIQPVQCWEKVIHVFYNYGPGVRYVKFKHAAKDVLFWKGHFGTWVTKTSLTVRLKDHVKK